MAVTLPGAARRMGQADEFVHGLVGGRAEAAL
jgi:hypothetical protein